MEMSKQEKNMYLGVMRRRYTAMRTKKVILPRYFGQ